jgi:hypothetical protein
MTRVAPSIVPTRGNIIISSGPRRPVVPGGSALRTSLPVPFTREEITRRASQFSLKIDKRQSS